jgi:hypothetical protein
MDSERRTERGGAFDLREDVEDSSVPRDGDGNGEDDSHESFSGD